MLVEGRLQSFTEPLSGLLCKPDGGLLPDREARIDVGLTARIALLCGLARTRAKLVNELAERDAVCQRSLDELGVFDTNEVSPLTHPRPSLDVGGSRIVSARLVLDCDGTNKDAAEAVALGEARDEHEIAFADDSRSLAGRIRKHPVTGCALEFLERRSRERGGIAAHPVKLHERLPFVSGVSEERGNVGPRRLDEPAVGTVVRKCPGGG